MPVAIHIGVTCRYCHKLIPPSIAPAFGSDENGHVCPECIEKHIADLQQLGRELANIPVADWPSGMADQPCVMCNRNEYTCGYLVVIDGRMGIICGEWPDNRVPCIGKFMELNRDQFRGTKLEFDLKLR